MARVGDGDILRRLSRLASVRLDLLNDVHAFDNGAENDVTIVQPRRLDSGDEELRSISVGSSVRHRHDAWPSVLQGEVFILEFVSIDRLAAGAVVVGEVSALAHEVGNDAVECRALISVALFAGAQCTEVLACLRNDIGAKLKRRE